jgi:hypothetical protein
MELIMKRIKSVDSILVSRNHLQAGVYGNFIETSFHMPNLKISPTRDDENLISRPKVIGPNLNHHKTNTACSLA